MSENIKCICTSFCDLFYPISRRVQMHFILSDNVRTLCSSYNVKEPKNRCSVETSVVLIVFDDVLCEVRAHTVAVSYGRSA